MTKQIEIFRAAIVQLRSGRAVAPNIDIACQLIRRAAGGGADYVLTPENTALMELKANRLFANAEPEENNSAIEAFSDLARELSIWLHIGGMAVQLSETQLANRSLLFTPEGKISARYDKIHMFDVDLPGGESYRESKLYKPGTKAVLVDLPWGRLGMTICYDLRFAYLYRALAQGGADIITVPAAFTKQTGQAHWHTLLRARAIETGCYILAAAQGGDHEVGRATFGHSLIISPWGEVIAEAGTEPTVIFADIDLSKVKESRRRVPSVVHNQTFELITPDGLIEIKEAS